MGGLKNGRFLLVDRADGSGQLRPDGLPVLELSAADMRDLTALFDTMARLRRPEQSPVEKMAEQLQQWQDGISAMQGTWPLWNDQTIQFRALGLAWEAVRLAWYALKQGDDGGHWQDFEAVRLWYERNLSQEVG